MATAKDFKIGDLVMISARGFVVERWEKIDYLKILFEYEDNSDHLQTSSIILPCKMLTKEVGL